MRILIDECLNRRLRRALPGHQVSSVQEMGWSGLRNGELLAAMAEAGFEVFLTGDRNLQFQQHVPSLAVAVVVLAARSTKLVDTLPLMGQVEAVLTQLQPGQVRMIYPERAG